MNEHKYITYVADRAARREVEALFDFYGVGQLIVSGELTYEAARDQMTQAFKVRDMQASTAKVYVSQGFCLAQLFDTFAEVTEYADAECGGSRSLKRIYDSTRTKADKAEVTEGDAATVETVKASQLSVVLAALPHLTELELVTVVRAIAAQNNGVLPIKAAA